MVLNSNIMNLVHGVVVGEDIWAAAIREVREETGIECEFIQLLCFRQHNKYMFGMYVRNRRQARQ